MPPDQTLQQALDRAATVSGLALAGVFGAMARLRGGRPLHPQGAPWTATLTMTGTGSTGVPWLDEPGSHEVTARVSRSVGLPRPLPDVFGIALRVPVAGSRPADLLFASTGDSAAGRFVFRPAFGVATRSLTTLLPVRSPRGALVLRLAAEAPGPVGDLTLPVAMTLSAALGTGPWQHLATLTRGTALGPDSPWDRHDPVVHQLPGTEQYEVVRRLREPAYVAARKVSRSPMEPATPARRRRA